MAKPAQAATLWLLWVLASLAGLEIAFWLAQPVTGRLLFGLRQTGLDPQVVGLFRIPVQLTISGAALGLAQWLVLRRYLSKVGWWPAASAVGSLTAAAPLVVLNVVALPFHHLLTPPEALVYAALTGCVTGIFIALAQLVVLRPKVDGSGLWLASGVVGYGLGTASTMAMSVFLFLPYELNGAPTGGIAGAISGAALIRLLGKEPPSHFRHGRSPQVSGPTSCRPRSPSGAPILRGFLAKARR